MEVKTNKFAFSGNAFRDAFMHSGIGMALVSPKGEWLKINPCLEKIVGYPEEELLSKTFQDITHPDDLDADLGQVQKMLAGEIETYSMKKRYFHKDGHIVWVLLTVSLVWKKDETPDFFISQIQDITQQVALEKKLEDEEKKHKKILETMANGLYIFNVERQQVEYMNATASEVSGWYVDDLEHLGERFYLLFHDEDRDQVKEHLARVINSDTDKGQQATYRFQKKDGSWMWCESFDAPFERNEKGEVTKFLGSFIDITEKKEAEAIKAEKEAVVEKMNQAMTGRELRMVELKEEVDTLLVELGREKKYRK